MCWFIHLEITPAGRRTETEAMLRKTAADQGLQVFGMFPSLTLTDGHCSCDLVSQRGVTPSVLAFLRDLVADRAVKCVGVGWAFGNDMPENAPVEKLELSEFLGRNSKSDLTAEMWYRLNDPSK